MLDICGSSILIMLSLATIVETSNLPTFLVNWIQLDNLSYHTNGNSIWILMGNRKLEMLLKLLVYSYVWTYLISTYLFFDGTMNIYGSSI